MYWYKTVIEVHVLTQQSSRGFVCWYKNMDSVQEWSLYNSTHNMLLYLLPLCCIVSSSPDLLLASIFIIKTSYSWQEAGLGYKRLDAADSSTCTLYRESSYRQAIQVTYSRYPHIRTYVVCYSQYVPETCKQHTYVFLV